MRLAIFSIYLSSLIITSAYSASLISFLTTKTNLPFSTLEGYIKDGTYKLIVMKNSSEHHLVDVSLHCYPLEILFK